jgi:hypothetical protein
MQGRVLCGLHASHTQQQGGSIYQAQRTPVKVNKWVVQMQPSFAGSSIEGAPSAI